MGATRMHKGAYQSGNPEHVGRRRSTRNRRRPIQWWKGGSTLLDSMHVKVAELVPPAIPDSTRKPINRPSTTCNKRLKPGRRVSFQFGDKSVRHARIKATAVDNGGSPKTANLTAAHGRESRSQPNTSNATNQDLLDNMRAFHGQIPSSGVAKAETRALDSTMCHNEQSVLVTSGVQKTSTETPGQNDDYMVANESKSITTRNDFLEKADCGPAAKSSPSLVSSGLPIRQSGKTSFNSHHLGSFFEPNSNDSNVSALEMRGIRERKAGPIEEYLSSSSAQERCSPLSANVSDNLPQHENSSCVVYQLSECLASDGMMLDGDHRGPEKSESNLRNEMGYILAKDLGEQMQTPMPSGKVFDKILSMTSPHAAEPRSQDKTAKYVGAREAKPNMAQGFQIPNGCSYCRSRVCVCEYKRDALTRETADLQSTMSFKVRRGSEVHHTTENGVFGGIKFGIRSCRDGILVGELTICSRSATGFRRTSGYKECYIVLRGFLILEVEDSTIHLREGDEVDFEGNIVFQLRNPCIRATNLLCFLLSTE